MRALLAAACLLAAGPAAGQTIARETFSVLGWNNACSVAVQHFGYAALGKTIQDEPVLTRIGAITIPPGENASRTVWAMNQGAKKALQDLVAAGYERPGITEDIRIPRAKTLHPIEEIILSTAAFGLRAEFPWPGGDWRWEQVRYSPLGDCGLFIFSRREDNRTFYRYFLLRFYTPSVRSQRAQAHLTYSRLLFEASELEAALAETATAAHMQPELASARYRHAALLCLSGQLNEAVSELSEAVRLDAELVEKARTDPDFEEVYGFPGFRGLIRKKP